MSKKLKLIFIMSIIMSIFLTYITQGVNSFKAQYGDINMNGKIDMSDAKLLMQYIKGTTNFNKVQLGLADVNCDGEVTSFDYSLILSKLYGGIKYFPTEVTYGDLDGDKSITKEDAKLVVEYFKGERNLSEKQLAVADVNGSGKVNSKDAKLILQRAQGLIVAFPVESASNVTLSTESSEKIIKTSRSVLQDMINENITYGAQTWGNIKRTATSDRAYVSSTYVSVVLYKSGLLTENQINSYNYHYTGKGGISDMLEAAGWTKVKASEARPGDIINVYGYHTLIYAGGNYCYDVTCAQDNHSTEPKVIWSYYKNDSRTQVWRASKTTTNKSTNVTTAKGIKGYYTSTVSGKKFTLYSQNIQGSPWYWPEGSFVTSQATSASGFGSELTPKDFSGFGSLGYLSDFQTKCGCKYSREYNIDASKMKQYLQNGKVIMIELKGANLKTDNGSAYYSQHYVSILDYKNENGVDKVYIHDPWEGSASYGWAKLDDIVNVASCFDIVWK